MAKKTKEPQFIFNDVTWEITCTRPKRITAKVVKLSGNGFHLRYDGHRSNLVDSIIQRMRDWYYYTHVKKEPDGHAKN